MLSPVARLLKQRTARSHERVEAALGVLGPELSSQRLRIVLVRLAGFWQGTERLVDDWAGAETTMPAALNWPRRRRGEVLRQDLLRLGLTVRELAEIPEAPPVVATVDTAAALGWLYVSEGSTLGGAVIDRTLRSLPDGARLRARTFTPYLEGPGPMWRSYLSCLGQWVGADDTRQDAVLASAVATFAALETWLAPISAEVAV